MEDCIAQVPNNNASGGQAAQIMETKQVWRGDIHSAAAGGDVDLVKRMICMGADVNSLDKEGHSPAAIAAKCGHREVVSVLVRAISGAPIRDPEISIHDALEKAVRDGSLEEVERLLAIGALPDTKAKNGGWSLLNIAIHGGFFHIVQLLLAYGADENGMDEGVTPVVVAVCMQRTQILQHLILCGANPDKPCGVGMTPLGRAALIGYRVGVELLLQSAAGMEVRMESGETPLQIAVTQRHGTVVQLLLRYGAITYGLEEKTGAGALHIAAKLNLVDMVAILLGYTSYYYSSAAYGGTVTGAPCGGVTVSSAPATSGGDMDDGDDGGSASSNGASNHIDHNKRASGGFNVGRNRISCKARGSHSNVKRMPVVDVCAVDKMRSTALHYATYVNAPDVVTMLLRHSGSQLIHLQDANGRTAFHWAALHEDSNAGAMMALFHFALKGDVPRSALNLDAIDLSGQSALCLALHRRCLRSVDMLLRMGANWQDDESLSRAMWCGGEYNGNNILCPELAFEAALGGFTLALQLLLHMGQDVNALHPSTGSPLVHYALASSSRATVDCLSRAGADFTARGNDCGSTSLIVTARVGWVQLGRMLLDELRVDVNELSNSGVSALHCAAEQGHVEMVDLLLHHGAQTHSHPPSLSILQTRAESALLKTVSLVGTSDPVGIGQQPAGGEGSSATRQAAVHDEKDANKSGGEERGGDGMGLEEDDKTLRSPLDLAARNGFAVVFARLLVFTLTGALPPLPPCALASNTNTGVKRDDGVTGGAGCDCDDCDGVVAGDGVIGANEGAPTAATIAGATTSSGTKREAMKLPRPPCLSQQQCHHPCENPGITSTGAVLHDDVKNWWLTQYLFVAAANGYIPLMRCLLTARIFVCVERCGNSSNKLETGAVAGGTGSQAIRQVNRSQQQDKKHRRRKECVLRLPLKPFHIDRVNEETGRTALHFAAMTGERAMLHYLLKHGANINAQDSGGHTPLHLALEQGHIHAAEMLCHAGADSRCRDASGISPVELLAARREVEGTPGVVKLAGLMQQMHPSSSRDPRQHEHSEGCPQQQQEEHGGSSQQEAGGGHPRPDNTKLESFEEVVSSAANSRSTVASCGGDDECFKERGGGELLRREEGGGCDPSSGSGEGEPTSDALTTVVAQPPSCCGGGGGGGGCGASVLLVNVVPATVVPSIVLPFVECDGTADGVAARTLMSVGSQPSTPGQKQQHQPVFLDREDTTSRLLPPPAKQAVVNYEGGEERPRRGRRRRRRKKNNSSNR